MGESIMNISLQQEMFDDVLDMDNDTVELGGETFLYSYVYRMSFQAAYEEDFDRWVCDNEKYLT